MCTVDLPAWSSGGLSLNKKPELCFDAPQEDEGGGGMCKGELSHF